MRITTQTEYAVRSLVHLVGLDKPISVSTLASREGLSRDYVEQIMIRMRRTGLVKSFRGVQGGYMLARKPEAITIGNILSSVEDRAVFEAPCDQPLKGCKGQDNCNLGSIWQMISIHVVDAFSRVTLLDAWKATNDRLPRLDIQ